MHKLKQNISADLPKDKPEIPSSRLTNPLNSTLTWWLPPRVSGRKNNSPSPQLSPPELAHFNVLKMGFAVTLRAFGLEYARSEEVLGIENSKEVAYEAHLKCRNAN